MDRRLPMIALGFAALLLGLGARAEEPAAPIAPPQGEELEKLKAAFRRPEAPPPAPKRNPPTPEKIALGETLFFDPRLSRDQAQSCASCHDPDRRWSDGLARASGFQGERLPRRTPGLMNAAWGLAFQWDGRAETLEAQARMPITAPNEMNMDMTLLTERLRAVAGYAPLFEAAFGPAPEDGALIDETRILDALASFQRSLVSERAPFDAWIEGEEEAIGPEARRGFALFAGPARCSACHSGWRFTDDSFHDIGLKLDPEAAEPDLGRGAFVPPEVVGLRHAFKTPSLRDLAPEGFHMHDGSLRGIAAVIDHYVEGGEKRESLSFEMRPVPLAAQERADLVAFLESLAAPEAPRAPPPIP
ncbi:cytochrome c peroxidase [Neomegalonema sp.]|uniref:cytochrome c peroxidase n=1 Tax=Neomegalonema sp. TaxID=2039713 RepID=UPI00261002BB|nr:cytochrome c peroxidase [Neomegalonema sp.]MDD2867340.1 cytochrome c peroxidase [Neomegalonema sp.]